MVKLEIKILEKNNGIKISVLKEKDKPTKMEEHINYLIKELIESLY